MMVPSNMLLSMFKPRWYLPTVVIIWGIVSGATGFVQNFPGLVVLRFLVGVTEAPYFPGCIFFLSSWYKKDELPSRIAIFYTGYTLASAFGGLIAAGIVNGMEGAGGYGSWRWIFIIEGALTVVVGFLGYVLLPNYPSNTPFLSEVESTLAQYRLARENDSQEDRVTESVFVGLKQALVDPKTWLLVLIQTGAVLSMSFTCKSNSSPFVLSSLNDTSHRLLPIDCSDPGLPQSRNPPAHRAALLHGLYIFHCQLLAQRTHQRAMLPHRHRCRHLDHRSDCLDHQLQHRRPLLCHVPPSYGFLFHLPAHTLLGLFYHPSTQGQAGCCHCPLHCHLECDEHRFCLSIPFG